MRVRDAASRRAPGIILLLLSFPLLMLGLTAGREAADEAGVRASQLQQSAAASDPQERDDFLRYAESTLLRQQDAEHDRNWLLGVAVMGAAGGLLVLLTGRRRPRARVEPAGQAAAEPPRYRPCRVCEWQISVEASMCPRCGAPHVPDATPMPAGPPLPVNKLQRAFYITLIGGGLGAAVVLHTILFGSLSETQLVWAAPYWIFPLVFGYYGLVAQRMAARLQTTHLNTVSEQLLTTIKDIGGTLGQAFAFLVHAPFLVVRNDRPWIVAFVGSLIWAIALVIFFNAVWPSL
jgi:hypothetical protein